MAKTIECPSCGAIIDVTESACPYCGSTNLPGAKLQYKKKLHDMVDGLEEMKDDSFEEAGRELKRTGRKLVKALIIFLALVAVIGVIAWRVREKDNRAMREEYTWKQENFDKWDELYKSGDYDELLTLYEEAMEQDKPVYTYSHYAFLGILEEVKFVDGMLATKDGPEFSAEELTLILCSELRIAGAQYNDNLSEKELACVQERGRGALSDLKERFGLSPDDLGEFEESIKKYHGSPDYDECRAYVEKMGE